MRAASHCPRRLARSTRLVVPALHLAVARDDRIGDLQASGSVMAGVLAAMVPSPLIPSTRRQACRTACERQARPPGGTFLRVAPFSSPISLRPLMACRWLLRRAWVARPSSRRSHSTCACPSPKPRPAGTGLIFKLSSGHNRPPMITTLLHLLRLFPFLYGGHLRRLETPFSRPMKEVKRHRPPSG